MPHSADPGAVSSEWRKENPLVRTPFFLSPDFEILWPRPTAAATEDEIAFLKFNRDFVMDRAEIPVYQNIVEVYSREIAGLADLQDSVRIAAAPAPKSLFGTQASIAEKTKPKDRAEAEIQPEASVAAAEPEKISMAPPPDFAARQTALKEFESSEDIRRKIYDQARQRGREPMSRVVVPEAESLFISEPMTFSRIIEGRESGLIPRFLGEDLALFFWKKVAGGAVLGCVVDSGHLKSRLMDLLPEAYTTTRILTVLDESGRPLFVPAEDETRDWRRPFISREISEVLPRWEAAAYLTDPGLIRSRADFRAFVLWVLVLAFVVSILSGGTLVLKTLRREMETARNKTTFVANVSHELKTPLTSIRMFAEMLKEGRQNDPAKKDRYLGLMVSETDRLTRLINNVLDFSRMDKGNKTYSPRHLNAGRVLQEIAESQRPRLEHGGFRLSLRVPDDPVFIRADEEALKQAVINLLSNAENYSGEAREIEIEVEADAGDVLIRVLDRGIGVSPGHAGQIFKEFFRADDSLTARTRGTGLGLAIARRLMRDQGGDIVYEPRSGGGSRFEIRLPRAEAP
jgi:signal transduction histidine kinase